MLVTVFCEKIANVKVGEIISPCVNMTGDRVSVLKNGFSMDEELLLIAKKVIFDSARMTLANGNKIIKISESETNLLLAFHRGIYKKEDIIDFVWKNRAGCVSESSYYKLINQMRNNFSLVGLKADDIVTRPRIGVSLSLPLEPLKKQRSEAGEQTSDTARGKDSRQTHLAEGKKITAKIRHLVLTMLLMLLTAIAMLFQHAPVQNKHKSTFRMLGDKDGYIFFKMASDKVTFKEVVSAYNTLTLPLCRQNGHYLYYLREPNMNLFLQCLNPVETAVPKCITIKERY
ncbi:hypothetical protein L3P98_14030 [Klebsiella pneumoniae]|nr:hypothetical protein [Klebsiella pneumoniae]MDF9975815.1 hypothetical protein [Klebsiella pneumoniae]MDK7837511.1 hypothetical protein [Klebsiella pneumoniae]SSF31541.1 Uncharacterised protein [Klebsiella pneumoniae]